MELNKKQLELLENRKIVVLATADSLGKPRAIFVEVNKVENDTIIITNNEMEITKNNLLQNKQVAILAFEQDHNYGLKISGEAKYHTKGKYFDFVKTLEVNQNYSPKGALVINIKAVSEF